MKIEGKTISVFFFYACVQFMPLMLHYYSTIGTYCIESVVLNKWSVTLLNGVHCKTNNSSSSLHRTHDTIQINV